MGMVDMLFGVASQARALADGGMAWRGMAWHGMAWPGLAAGVSARRQTGNSTGNSTQQAAISTRLAWALRQ